MTSTHSVRMGLKGEKEKPRISMVGSERARSSRKPAGFTLLELLIVLVIAAALVALVPPAINRVLPGVKLKGASQEMASAIRFLRGWSVSQGEQGLFLLDLEEKHYTITPREKVYEIPQSAELKMVAASDEGDGEQQGGIRFFPDGSSSGGRITLSGGGRSHRIDVDWLTGRVSLVH
ncbi:MAG: GspH/FimT family pseudopilin [Candidatus Thiodiazotropha sp. (ex Ctena orbiculata)]|nr:GspH/FimT family pseudopilin [Candidatus Thiodiazotropha taylori]